MRPGQAKGRQGGASRAHRHPGLAHGEVDVPERPGPQQRGAAVPLPVGGVREHHVRRPEGERGTGRGALALALRGDGLAQRGRRAVCERRQTVTWVRSAQPWGYSKLQRGTCKA